MKERLLLIGAVVGLAIAGFLFFRSARSTSQSADFPNGMHWLCTNCNHGFTTSREAFADWVKDHPDQRLACPKCKSNTTVVAKKCPLPNCGRYYVQRNLVIDGKVSCPICKQPLP